MTLAVRSDSRGAFTTIAVCRPTDRSSNDTGTPHQSHHSCSACVCFFAGPADLPCLFCLPTTFSAGMLL